MTVQTKKIHLANSKVLYKLKTIILYKESFKNGEIFQAVKLWKVTSIKYFITLSNLLLVFPFLNPVNISAYYFKVMFVVMFQVIKVIKVIYFQKETIKVLEHS